MKLVVYLRLPKLPHVLIIEWEKCFAVNLCCAALNISGILLVQLPLYAHSVQSLRRLLLSIYSN